MTKFYFAFALFIALAQSARASSCFLVQDGSLTQTVGCYASDNTCNNARGAYMATNPALYVDLCYSEGYIFFYNHDQANAFYSDPETCSANQKTAVQQSQGSGSVGPCIRIF